MLVKIPSCVTYGKILAHVRDHLRRFYGNSRTLLLLVEPNAHGAHTNFLDFSAFYFEKWKQGIKVNGSYNYFDQFFSGVPKDQYQFHHYLKYTFMIYFFYWRFRYNQLC